MHVIGNERKNRRKWLSEMDDRILQGSVPLREVDPKLSPFNQVAQGLLDQLENEGKKREPDCARIANLAQDFVNRAVEARADCYPELSKDFAGVLANKLPDSEKRDSVVSRLLILCGDTKSSLKNQLSKLIGQPA